MTEAEGIDLTLARAKVHGIGQKYMCGARWRPEVEVCHS